MKKYLKLLVLMSIILLLPSCNVITSEYIIPNEKPNNHYYSSQLYSNIKNNTPYTIKVFNMDTYTYYDVDANEPDIILGFLESLKIEDYNIEYSENSSILYKIIIEFKSSKYVINIFNNNFVTLHPWDGTFKQDIISTENVSDYYNLYEFCNYIKNRNKDL